MSDQSFRVMVAHFLHFVRGMSFKTTLKNWMLPIAMVGGASLYLIYYIMPEPVHRLGPILEGIVSFLQPLLIFSMLFLTFCQIQPKDLKPHRWHWWLLLIQGGVFVLLTLLAAALVRWVPDCSSGWIVLIESAMLCFICPTATAAAVVTRKLKGDVPGITTYIVLINILTAVLVPLMLPLMQGSMQTDFWTSFSLIMAKVFPVLITPCLAAWLVRSLMPKFYRWLMRCPDLAFYLWSVALTLAIAVTTKSIMASSMSLGLLGAMAGVSLLCCAIQFAVGRFVGGRYRPLSKRGQIEEYNKVDNDILDCEVRKVTAGQSLGQKNTVFAIWMAYTFMTPETAIIGGFYSIWHNVYNSWQLYRSRKS